MPLQTRCRSVITLSLERTGDNRERKQHWTLIVSGSGLIMAFRNSLNELSDGSP